MSFGSIDKLEELRQLVRLHDIAIAKQKTVLTRTEKGSFKSAGINDYKLYALVLGDLKRLRSMKQACVDKLASLESITQSAAAKSDQEEEIE